jgi:HD-like signal output (HDOD) protein
MLPVATPKRILFVDDDSAALEALQRALRARAGEWALRFVLSGEQALEELTREPCDVIVSAVRMAAMDGVQLLRSVSERWPQTVRIAISGLTDLTESLRVLPLAHQYLAKPCRPAQLDHVIARCLALRETLSGARVQATIGRIRQLPARPRIFARLQVIMAHNNVTARDVGQLIMGDAVITAKVLQIANSAFFRRARRIANIEQAVMYLGFSGVRNLVMCAEVFSRWPGKLALAAVDLGRMQQHAQRVAAVAHALTINTSWEDETVLAALLHDIGYWVLAQECPQELERALEAAVADAVPLHEAERRLIGASHAEIGAYLLGIWGLPYSIVEAVAYHHEPQRPGLQQFDVHAGLAIAAALAGTDDTDAFRSSPPRAPVVGPQYLQALGAPFNWSEAERRATECLARVEAEPA